MPPINKSDRKELGKLLQSLAAGDQVLARRNLAEHLYVRFWRIVLKTPVRDGLPVTSAPKVTLRKLFNFNMLNAYKIISH